MSIFTRIGRIIRVKNTKTRSFSHESESYLAIWVKDADGINARCLLFTDSEIAKAEARGLRNEEDHPKRSWISRLLD